MDIDKDPHYHVMRLTFGLVPDDEHETVEAFVREHGFELVSGKWKRKPRERRPDPAPISGEIVTRSDAPEPWFYRLHKRKHTR